MNQQEIQIQHAGKQEDDQHSKMLIVSNSEQHFDLLIKLLQNYFPSEHSYLLRLTTKYYSTCIKPTRLPWPTLEQYQALANHSDLTAHKHDLMVMVLDHTESYPSELFDLLIQVHNPDNFLLIVNTPLPQAPYSQEERIKDEVNNFLEIVRQNLQNVVNNPPERKTGKGLLNDSYEDGNIFNLVELMETTQWSCMKRTQKTKDKNEPAEMKEEGDVKKIQGQKTQKTEEQQVKESDEYVSEQQLEKQMDDFECIFKQMMSIKSMQPQAGNDNTHQQRKQQAQQLINQLLKGSFL